MAKIIKEAHNPNGVPKELKEEFFKKLLDLCCQYGVHIGACEIETEREFESEEYDFSALTDKDIDDLNKLYKENPELLESLYDNATKNIQKIPALYFNFYDGSEYEWSDGILEYDNHNTFINYKDTNDVISICGVRYDQEENE